MALMTATMVAITTTGMMVAQPPNRCTLSFVRVLQRVPAEELVSASE